MCLWGVLQCGDTARAKVDQSRPGRLVPDSKPTVSGAELRKATGGEIAELRKLEAWFGSSLMCLHAVGVHAPTLVKAPAFFPDPSAPQRDLGSTGGHPWQALPAYSAFTLR